MNAPGVPQPSSARGATVYAYDLAGRLVSLDNNLQPGVLADRQQYTFDADDRIIRQTTQEFGAAANTALVDYQYDKTDQLKRADHNDTADETYGYDTIGNRANHTVQPNLHARVVGDGTFNYTYDNEGNLVTKTRISSALAADWQTTYAWDYRNRLKSVTQTSNDATPLVATTTYFYDAFDHRITQKVEAGGNVTYTQFAYQGDQLLLARAANGTVTDRFLTGADGRVLAQDATSGQRWLLPDQLGSVRTVLAADGAILGRLDYDSFGRVTSATTPATAGSLFGYADGVYDATTGLNYYQARYYDSFTGRWLSEDPIGFAGGDTNLYRYVGNNPVNATDPTGLSTSYLGNSSYGSSYYGGSSSYGSAWDYAGYNSPFLSDLGLAPPQPAAYVPWSEAATSGVDSFYQQQPSPRGFWAAVGETVATAGSYAYDTASLYPRFLGTELSTAGNTILETGRSAGDFVGDHATMAYYDPGAEAARVQQSIVQTAVGIKNTAAYVYNNPLDAAAGAGAAALDYADRLTSDPIVSGELLGQGTVAWATGGAGAAGKQLIGRGVTYATSTLAPSSRLVPIGELEASAAELSMRGGLPSSAAVQNGNLFNRLRENAYPFKNVYVDRPGGGRGILDSYNPGSDIVSRKFTQLASISERSAIAYVREAATKYAPGTRIADVVTNRALSGQVLEGRLYLEVPIQSAPVPQGVLNAARRYGVTIRDVNGLAH